MKKLPYLLVALLNCITIATLNAELQHNNNELQHKNCVFPVVECKILLEKGDYVKEKGNIFIKQEVEDSIFESVKAWQMLEFKVFIYIQCDYCGASHLADYPCNSDMCKNRVH